MLNECMDNIDVKADTLDDFGGEITFRGWNIKNPDKIVLEEVKEYYEGDEIIKFRIINKKEHAYSCSRFNEGEDANDEGYNYYLDYYDVWKKGLGKCTTFTIYYEVIEKKEDN